MASRTAAVERIKEGWRVSCREESEVAHALFIYDEDCNGLYEESFSVALGRAEMWILAGVAAPFMGVAS